MGENDNRETVTLICAGCGVSFERDKRAYLKRKRLYCTPDEGFYCKRECKWANQSIKFFRIRSQAMQFAAQLEREEYEGDLE